ncbi:MAG: ABC transporter permease [Ferrovibrio sp.]
MSSPSLTPPKELAPKTLAPREYGPVNWLGLWTLYVKEVQRFLKVVTQTVLAPMVTTLLFFAVFALALGGAVRHIAGMPFIDFLAPGLIMMATTQNAFANTSSSIMISKVQGNIVDVLMPPISAGELLLAYIGAGVTRGLLVALAVAAAIFPFAPIHVHSWFAAVYFVLAGSLILSLIGVVAGLWSQKFDHMAAVTNFIVTPLAFLSGTFYSVQALPPLWYAAAHANPFFFMIDGFRFGLTGHTDGDVLLGGLALAVVAIGLWIGCYMLLKRGYRLRP